MFKYTNISLTVKKVALNQHVKNILILINNLIIKFLILK